MEWLHPATGRYVKAPSVTVADGPRNFVPPTHPNDDWVLHLRRKDYPSSPNAFSFKEEGLVKEVSVHAVRTKAVRIPPGLSTEGMADISDSPWQDRSCYQGLLEALSVIAIVCSAQRYTLSETALAGV